jgi:hypothetical protein
VAGVVAAAADAGRELMDGFAQTGFANLGQILTPQELAHYTDAFDKSRLTLDQFWIGNGIWQTELQQPLMACKEFDGLLMHPKVLAPLRLLAGGEVCIEDVALRHMGPYNGREIPGMTSWEPEGAAIEGGVPEKVRGVGNVGRRWHRDGDGGLAWDGHPLGVAYFQLMVYLADVTDDTHSFAVSPQPVGTPLLDGEGELDHAAQLARGGLHNLNGPAGTALLFNIDRLHTVCVRQTTAERKSLQAYYGHAHVRRRAPEVAPHPGRLTLCVPPRLWRDHTDPAVREFFGGCSGASGAPDAGLNQRSLQFAAAEEAARAAGEPAWNIEQAMEKDAALDAHLLREVSISHVEAAAKRFGRRLHTP